MDENVVNGLRKAFKLTNAVFEAQELIIKALGGIYTPSLMHNLHSDMKIELEKEKPDAYKIDFLLELMENNTELNSKK